MTGQLRQNKIRDCSHVLIMFELLDEHPAWFVHCLQRGSISEPNKRSNTNVPMFPRVMLLRKE